MNTTPPKTDQLGKSVAALSAKRLAWLTGAFLLALSVLLVMEIREEAEARRQETSLVLRQTAFEGASAVNIAAVTGTNLRTTLQQIWPGGQSAVIYVTPRGHVLDAVGATAGLELPPATLLTLDLRARGHAELDLANGTYMASWQPLDNSNVLMAIAPARDMYARSRIWVVYAIIFAAMAVVVISLMAAFIRQSRAAAGAAEALAALDNFNQALAGGRCSPWFYMADNRSVGFTRAFLEPLGLGARDRRFSMREISALVHPKDLRRAIAIFSGEPAQLSEGHVRLRAPGGGWSEVFLRTAEGATRFSRAGIAIDLERKRQNDQPTLDIAETHLRDAIEAISEAFVLWDANGRLSAWNKRFARLFQINESTLEAGKSAKEVGALAKVNKEIFVKYFAPSDTQASTNEEVALPGAHWMNVSRKQTSNGSTVCMATNVSALKRRAVAHKRKERELEKTVEELEASRTELSKAVRKYEYAKYRAEEANRSKSEFLANMSHELRTPLNAINGFSEIMESEFFGPLGDEKYKEYAADILTSGRHLLSLIDDVLDMSRIEAGQYAVNLGAIDLERILNESARLLAKRAKDANVTLNIAIDDCPAVWADARAAKQVAINLLTNAVKYTHDGGDITLTIDANLDVVSVIVADTGCGIERSQLKKLGAPFELLSTNSDKSSSTGTGLGLALSKSLMELQGGILALVSQPGEGTVACAAFARRKDAPVELPNFIKQEAHVLTGAKQEPDFEAPAHAAE